MIYLAIVGLPLQPVAGDRVMQESQRFEEVRLPAGVRADEDGQRLKRQVNLIQAAEVLDLQTAQIHRLFLQLLQACLERRQLVVR